MADERSRMEASQALSEQLGPAAAAALMECIPPFGWHEIATKSDLRSLEQRLIDRFESQFAALRGEIVGLEGRFDGLEGRIVGLKGELTAAFHAETTRLLRWIVPTIFAGLAAFGGVLGGIVAVSG